MPWYKGNEAAGLRGRGISCNIFFNNDLCDFQHPEMAVSALGRPPQNERVLAFVESM
jgi:hypothetical protein